MTDNTQLLAQAREWPPNSSHYNGELIEALAKALQDAEAETKETWLSLHARAVKAEEALQAVENDRDNWKELYDLALARADKNEAENIKLRKELDLAMLALNND